MKPIVIAGGGTGGHIYPALAIAQALKEQNPDLEIHFVGTQQGLEKKIVPQQGYPLHFVPVGMLNSNVGLLKRIKTLLLLPFAFLKALWLVLSLRPQAVLGVGGYASAPVLFVAGILGFDTYIWEPNAIPGLANRKLSFLVKKSLIVFESAKKYLKSKAYQQVGIPVRSEIENTPASNSTGGREGFHLLVFGGSQGALRLNEVLFEAIEKFPEKFAGIEVIHQIGRYSYPQFKEKYQGLDKQSVTVQPLEFIHDMPVKYQWADLLVCRGGASTLAEVAAVGKPSVIVPFPFAADDHQKKNAEQFVEKKAAHMILQKDLSAESLIDEILRLKKNPEALQEMALNVKALHRKKAAQEIAEILLSK